MCGGGCGGSKPSSNKSTYSPKSNYKTAAAGSRTYSSGRPVGYNPFATGSANFGKATVKTSFGRR